MTTTKHPILLVDDEEDILFSLKGLLRRDFEVHTAQSGAEALKILNERPIHVIMTDQRMPEMTGVELLKRAQGECPEAIRIVFTGYADIKAVIDAVNESHIYRYLTKPWDPGELRGVLEEACEEYTRISERQALLREMRDYLAHCQEILQSIPSDGRTARLVEQGQELNGRLEQTLQGM